MSVIYQAAVYDKDDNLIDTMECGGDDGMLPTIEMGPATAEEELRQLARDEYGDSVHIGKMHVKGATG